MSGIGIRYAPSAIVDAAHQAAAATLVVGERVPPQTFVRAADARPVDVQDILPADTRFKLLVFGGDVGVPEERAALQRVADALDKPENFLRRFGRADGAGGWEVFDVLCFSTGRQDAVTYLGERLDQRMFLTCA